ncbi:MAG: sterol desaturase family protein [Pseudomonadota bacterium]
MAVETMTAVFEAFGESVAAFVREPVNTGSRLFVAYLLLSLIAAYAIYRVRRVGGGFFRFLFPEHVWSHPHAWLDLRYFVFHRIIGGVIKTGAATAIGLGIILVAGSQTDVPPLTMETAPGGALAALLIGVVYLSLIMLGDFATFYIHYLQHKIPLLWQFHKVHHAGEVMHPISNYREHPIDIVVYDIGTGFVHGLALGLAMRVIGYQPGSVDVLGISVAVLLFNGAAYSLRHSHIWLRWPGRWSAVFGSPAHHQVHHSRHPDHLDKNFAFMFPVWDVLFGTYCMPDDNRDVEFGIVEDSSELNSCINLYAIPFRDAWRVLRSGQSEPFPSTLAAAARAPDAAE